MFRMRSKSRVVILGICLVCAYPAEVNGQSWRLDRINRAAGPVVRAAAHTRRPQAIIAGIAVIQDTFILGLRNLPQVRDTFYSCGATDCRLVTLYLGRDANVLADRLRSGHQGLVSYLDGNGLHALHYHFETAYPTVPWTSVKYTLSGRRYVTDRVADSLANALRDVNARLKEASEEDLVTLQVDVIPLGANVFLQSLGGDLHSTVANTPMGGLWLGKYDYWVRVGTHERYRGVIDFWDHPGRVLQCRFDYPQPGLGGCVQKR